MKRLSTALLMLAALAAQAGTPGSAFTYQGQLTENGTPAEGSYDFELALFDQDSGGTVVAVDTFEDVSVSSGLFQLEADFTAAPFEAGLPYWVEARVRPGDDSGAFTALLPRQAITASPYAIVAQAVLAPLDVPGDASIQGDLTVSGDITSPFGEVRAQRLEGEEIWSDGQVDFLGGVNAQRFIDAVALLVENVGGTEPALDVRTTGTVAMRLNGQIDCTAAGGCIGLDALAPELYAERGLIDWREATALIGVGNLGNVTALCADADDLLLFGACPTGGNFAIDLEGSDIANRGDLTQPLGYTCRYRNDFSSTRTGKTIAACLPLNP